MSDALNDQLVHSIFKQIASGQLDKRAGTELLQILKSSQRAEDKDSMAIIGMDVRLPDAEDTEQFWHNLQNGKDSIGPFPESRQQDVAGLKQFTYMKDLDAAYSQAGYLKQIDSFDYRFFGISPKEASLMDPNQRLFLEVAWRTLEDAGYGGKQLVGSRTGLYIGYSGWPMYGQFVSYTEPESFDMSVSGNISAIIASRIPYYLDLKGPSMLIDTACSSSLVALHQACKAIQAGECDQALVGGLRLTLLPLDGYVKYGIEASDSRAKAFDDQADGTGLSEGVTAIFIKPLRRALQDGDNIYAVIKGSAINQDGNSINITAPNALAQEDVIVRAWKDAGVDPTTISYIEAHGTGTKLGDPIEIDGIQKAFRRYTKKKQFCAIGSLKSNIGHTDAAAGLASIVKAALALRHKQVPPTLHFKFPNKQISFEQSPVYVNDRLSPWEVGEQPRRCGVSSFGFSGTNCHVVLEEAPEPETPHREQTKQPRLFVLSAKSESSMEQLVELYGNLLEKHPELDLDDLCCTASLGRGHYAYRLAAVVESSAELLAVMRELKQQGLRPGRGASYGFHKIVSAGRSAKEDSEVTESQLRQLAEQANRLLEPSEGEGASPSPSPSSEQLQELAALYCRGAEINWSRLYGGQRRRKLRLPLYPFEQTRCWLKVPAAPALPKTAPSVVPFADSDYFRLVYAEPWPQLGLAEAEQAADSGSSDRESSSLSFTADDSLTLSVDRLAESCGAQPRVILLTAYMVLLSKYSGNADVLVGIRTVLAAVPQQPGPESNRLQAVRHRAEGYKTFEYAVDEVGAVANDGKAYAATSAAWAESDERKFEAGFVFDEGEQEPAEWSQSDFMLRARRQGSSIALELTYRAEGLNAGIVERFADDYLHVLALVAENSVTLLQDISLPVQESQEELDFAPAFTIDFSIL